MYRQGINIEGLRKLLIVLAVVVLLALGLFGASRQAPAAERIVLKMASPFVGPPALITAPIVDFENLVTERTKGRVQFKNFWAGSLAGPGEILVAVGDGRADLIHYAPVYAYGKTPLGGIDFAFPFRPSDTEIIWKVSDQLRKEFPEFDEEYARYGGKVLSTWMMMSYDIIANKPIRTLDDMKGKKLTTIGIYMPDWVASSGAVPVTMPVQEHYVACQRGVLDGEILMMDMHCDFKMYEVLKHYTHAGLGATGGVPLLAHLKTWDKLPPDIQQVMLDVGREVGFAHAKRLANAEKSLMQLLKDNGVTFYTLSEQDKVRWATLMPDTPAKWAADREAKGLPGWKIVDRYIQLAEQYGHKWPRKWGQR